MQAITTIGLDIAKSVFQVHGIDAEDKVIIRRQLKRRDVLSAITGIPIRHSVHSSHEAGMLTDIVVI
jgi:hypothetical protein